MTDLIPTSLSALVDELNRHYGSDHAVTITIEHSRLYNCDVLAIRHPACVSNGVGAPQIGHPIYLGIEPDTAIRNVKAAIRNAEKHNEWRKRRIAALKNEIEQLEAEIAAYEARLQP
jgi:IMP cyclohydrolase